MVVCVPYEWTMSKGAWPETRQFIPHLSELWIYECSMLWSDIGAVSVHQPLYVVPPVSPVLSIIHSVAVGQYTGRCFVSSVTKETLWLSAITWTPVQPTLHLAEVNNRTHIIFSWPLWLSFLPREWERAEETTFPASSLIHAALSIHHVHSLLVIEFFYAFVLYNCLSLASARSELFWTILSSLCCIICSDYEETWIEHIILGDLQFHKNIAVNAFVDEVF